MDVYPLTTLFADKLELASHATYAPDVGLVVGVLTPVPPLVAGKGVTLFALMALLTVTISP